MHEALDTWFDFHKSSKVRDVGDRTGENRALLNALGHRVPRISLHLLDAQGYPVVFAVNADHLDGNFVALFESVLHAHVAFPGNFAHMH